MNFTLKKALEGGRDPALIADGIAYVQNGFIEHGQRLRCSPAVEGLSLPAIVSIATEACRQSHRTKSYTEHLVVGFTQEEYARLDEDKECEIVTRAVVGLGHNPESAIYVWGWHLEDGHPHLHIVIIRVDPSTGIAGGTRQPIREAEREAVLISHDLGFEPVLGRNNRASYADLTGQDLRTLPDSPLRSDRDWADQQSDRKHYLTWVARHFDHVSSAAKIAQTWPDFHRLLAERGLVADFQKRDHLKGKSDTGEKHDRQLFGLSIREAAYGPDQRKLGAKLSAFKTSYPRLAKRLGQYAPLPEDSLRRARLVSFRRQKNEQTQSEADRTTRAKAPKANRKATHDPIEARSRSLYQGDRSAHKRDQVERRRKAQAEAELQRQALRTEKQLWLAHTEQLKGSPDLRIAARTAVVGLARDRSAEIARQQAAERRRTTFPKYGLVRAVYRAKAAEQIQAEAARTTRDNAAQSVARRSKNRRSQEPRGPTVATSAAAGPASTVLDAAHARAKQTEQDVFKPRHRAIEQAWLALCPALNRQAASKADALTRPTAYLPWVRATGWELLDLKTGKLAAGSAERLKYRYYEETKAARSPELRELEDRHRPPRAALNAWLLVRHHAPEAADRAMDRVCRRTAIGSSLPFREALREAERNSPQNNTELQRRRLRDDDLRRRRLLLLQRAEEERTPEPVPSQGQTKPDTKTAAAANTASPRGYGGASRKTMARRQSATMTNKRTTKGDR